MPSSPDFGFLVAKQVAETYADATATMLDKVARRLARGIDTPGWAELKALEVHRLREEARAVVEHLEAAGPQAVDEAVRTAADRGAGEAIGDLRAARVTGELTRTSPAAVEALARATVGTVSATHPRILRAAEDIYRGTIAEASAQVSAGTLTRREAAQRSLDRFASAGVTGFIDDAGRSWQLESYAEMATRTASGRAAITGYSETLLANDVELGFVSSSPAPCFRCDPWEGLVLSLREGHPDYPSLGDAEAAGLYHVNCTHTVEAFLPGHTRTGRDDRPPKGEREERYEDRQEQRRIERGIREWKRREAVGLDDKARQRARAKQREWQARARANDAASPLVLRQRAREQVGKAR